MSTTSSARLATFANTATTIVRAVSCMPRRYPAPTSETSTAGAPNALIRRYVTAAIRTSGSGAKRPTAVGAPNTPATTSAAPIAAANHIPCTAVWAAASCRSPPTNRATAAVVP